MQEGSTSRTWSFLHPAAANAIDAAKVPVGVQAGHRGTLDRQLRSMIVGRAGISVHNLRRSAPMTPEPRSDLRPNSPSRAEEETNKTRQGVTGHNVRYVLFFSIAGVIVGFVLVYLFVFGD
jgi:hypothetical protein